MRGILGAIGRSGRHHGRCGESGLLLADDRRERRMIPRAPSDALARIEVHLVRLASVRQGAARIATLSEDERRCAIASRRRRTSFLAARLLVRELLARRLGCLPAEVPIILPSDGKPRLACGGIEFSLSHPEGWIAVALSGDCAVGIDAEPLRALVCMPEIVSEFFPQAARAEFTAASADRQTTVFFRWWTRIEAAVKASGRELDDVLSCFDGVSYESCDAVRGLACAVAARTERPPIVKWIVEPAAPQELLEPDSQGRSATS